jgi:uncharacterized protein (DUF427 family)
MTFFPIGAVPDATLLIDSPVTARRLWKGKATYWQVQGQSWRRPERDLRVPAPVTARLETGD